MFFEEYTYLIIDGRTITEIEEKVGLNQATRHLPLDSKPNQWAYYAYLRGMEAGLEDMYAINFGSIISSFCAGLGVDAGTDIYFQEKMDDTIFQIYEQAYNNKGNDGERVKQFFNEALQFYLSDDGACKYERAVFFHKIRVPCKLKQQLQKQGTIKEGILSLMDGTTLPHDYSTGEKCDITFKLTYTQETRWISQGNTDSERLQKLIQ